MRVEPAHVDQIRRASDGRMVLIDADAGGVAADLRSIDPGLKVRFGENGNPPFWAVYHESRDGRETHLVTTAQAYQTASGVWTGLDQRIVDRVREVDSHGRSGYDYAREVERQNERARESNRAVFRERAGEIAEHAAHAIRKDLGSTAKAFIPRSVP